MSYRSTDKSCSEEYNKRVSGLRLPEGFEDWVSYLRAVIVVQIDWTLGWLPVEEIVYMPATGPYFLLMGLQGIQPYVPYRVMRQLGRCQVVHPDEDLSIYAVEVSNDGQFHEKTVRYIWSECQYLPSNTRVCDLSRGEVSPAYLTWYRKKSIARDKLERPTKRPHLQDFAESSQEQWGWLAKEENYRAETGKLKQQIRDLEFENSVQAAAEKGEKNKLAQENGALKAQTRQIRKDANNQQRSRSDERLINGLKNQITECQKGLERSEASVTRIRARWAKGTEARAKHMR